MAIKNGDFIKLEFTGKIKETGEVFDTTNEEIAKETGILVKNMVQYLLLLEEITYLKLLMRLLLV